MKRLLTLLTIATFASCSLFAQDDMYFTPKSKAVKDKEKAEAKAAAEKKKAEEEAAYKKMVAEEEAKLLAIKKEWLRKNRAKLSQTEDGELVYHIGRDVSADEYNHRGKFKSSYEVVKSDSVASDIIEFTPGDGQYPDSLIASIDTISGTVKKKQKSYKYDDDDDYYYARLLNRFDGFYGSRRMWLLYNNPWYSHWAYDPFLWNDPWYWNTSWIYSPWYWTDPWYWNDPWYYGGYYGWSWGVSYYPHHYHPYHYHTPVVYIGGTASPSHGNRYARTHGTQAPRATYRDVSSGVRTQDRVNNHIYRQGDIPGFSGYRGTANSGTSGSYSNGRSARSSAPRSYTNTGSSYSNSGSRSYSNSSSTRSYSNSSSSSSSSSSYSSPSSSSSSSSSRSYSSSGSYSSGSRGGSSSGSFSGSRGGSGGGGQHGGRR